MTEIPQPAPPSSRRSIRFIPTTAAARYCGFKTTGALRKARLEGRSRSREGGDDRPIEGQMEGAPGSRCGNGAEVVDRRASSHSRGRRFVRDTFEEYAPESGPSSALVEDKTAATIKSVTDALMPIVSLVAANLAPKAPELPSAPAPLTAPPQEPKRPAPPPPCAKKPAAGGGESN